MQRRAALCCLMTLVIQDDNIPSIPSRNGGGCGGAALKARMEIAVCNRHKSPPPPTTTSETHKPQVFPWFYSVRTVVRFMLTASEGGVCMDVEIQW